MVRTIIDSSVKQFLWIDISEPEMDDLNILKNEYQINEASIKDTTEPDQFPKIEIFPEYTFIISRALAKNYEENSDTIGEMTDRLSIFYNEDFVITVHRKHITAIEKIAGMDFSSKRFKDSKHLVLSLITETFNTFLQPSSEISKQIDAFEELIFLKEKSINILKETYYIKRHIDVARKVFLFNKDIVEHFNSAKSKDIYTRDLKDLYLRITAIYDNLSENIAQLLNIYFNITSNRTNEIMRILTIFSVFFMPITFVAGVYGMNFKFMPEIEWYYGYPLCLLIMVSISAAIYFWFKRKKWL